MSDISSLDEEIVMKVVKFNEKKQKEMKNLSETIRIIGMVGSIVLKVAIPFIILAMLLVPYVVNNIEVVNNEITFKTDKIKIVDGNKIEIYDVLIGEFDGEAKKSDVIKMLEKNSSLKIICYIESALVFLIVDIIIMIIILKNVSKLFDNIKNNETPFTLDNVNYIKKISYLMIALIMITPISGLIINNMVGIPTEDSPFELMNILEILIIFSMSYIFEYGYEIQKDSKGIMYNE
jgi:flagellar biosynthesis protein FlhB